MTKRTRKDKRTIEERVAELEKQVALILLDQLSKKIDEL